MKFDFDPDPFICKKCGNCCKLFDCEMLDKDNTCMIYDKRPEICRIKKDALPDDIRRACKSVYWQFYERQNLKEKLKLQIEEIIKDGMV